jgi:hypothetical protein
MKILKLPAVEKTTKIRRKTTLQLIFVTDEMKLTEIFTHVYQFFFKTELWSKIKKQVFQNLIKNIDSEYIDI